MLHYEFMRIALIVALLLGIALPLIGSGVVFCNDRYPKSKNTDYKLEPILVREGASIGANSTILPGVTIGKNALIGAGSVVTKDVPDNTIVKGKW